MKTPHILKPSSNNAKLYLEVIDGQFDPNTDYVIGPWCFIGAEHLCSDFENIPFVEGFLNVEQLSEADRDTRELANQYVIQLSKRLNNTHARNYSVEYWRSMLILWLVFLIQASWRRYRHIEEFINVHGDETLDVHIYGGPSIKNPSTLNHFNNLMLHSPNYDFLVSSEIIKKLAPVNWNFITVNPDIEPQGSKDECQAIVSMSRSSRIIRRLFGRLSFNSVLGTSISRLFFSIFINVLPKIKYEGKSFDENKQIFEKMPKKFLEILDRLIALTIPDSYTKDFLHFETLAKKYKYYPGRLLIDHISQSSTSQAIAAQALAAGERLIALQHGGTDGNAKTTPWSEGEKQYYAWISWGWEEQEDIKGRIVPLPSPYLSRFRNKHRFKNDNLIFVGAKFYLRCHRFESCPTPAQFINYRHSKKIFIEKLPDQIFKKLQYRPYLRSVTTIDDEEYILRQFPKVQMLRGEMHTKILECRLLVLDHPGTTLNIAMAANIPTVLFWNRKHWPQCRQIEPLFEEFREKKLLFNDPESAARFIEQNWDDIESWWNSTAVQNLRNEWAYKYARTSNIWWLYWAREIWHLANGRIPNNVGKLADVESHILEN